MSPRPPCRRAAATWRTSVWTTADLVPHPSRVQDPDVAAAVRPVVATAPAFFGHGIPPRPSLPNPTRPPPITTNHHHRLKEPHVALRHRPPISAPVRIGALGLFLDETDGPVVRPTFRRRDRSFYQLPRRRGTGGPHSTQPPAKCWRRTASTWSRCPLVKDFMPAKPAGGSAPGDDSSATSGSSHTTRRSPSPRARTAGGRARRLPVVAEADLDQFCARFQFRGIREPLAAPPATTWPD